MSIDDEINEKKEKRGGPISAFLTATATATITLATIIFFMWAGYKFGCGRKIYKVDPGYAIPAYFQPRCKDNDRTGLPEFYLDYNEEGKPELSYLIRLYEENGKRELYLTPYEIIPETTIEIKTTKTIPPKIIPKEFKPTQKQPYKTQRQHKTQHKGN